MSDPSTLIVTALPNPAEMASVQEYLKGVLPLLTGAGGKPQASPHRNKHMRNQSRAGNMTAVKSPEKQQLLDMSRHTSTAQGAPAGATAK